MVLIKYTTTNSDWSAPIINHFKLILSTPSIKVTAQFVNWCCWWTSRLIHCIRLKCVSPEWNGVARVSADGLMHNININTNTGRYAHTHLYSVAKCLTSLNGYASLRLTFWDKFSYGSGWQQQFDKSDFLCCQSIVVCCTSYWRRCRDSVDDHFSTLEIPKFVKDSSVQLLRIILFVNVMHILENNYIECTHSWNEIEMDLHECHLLRGWLSTFSQLQIPYNMNIFENN